MLSRAQETFIAATRFGLGATPGELKIISKAPRDCLADQIRPSSFIPPEVRNLPSLSDSIAKYYEGRRARGMGGTGNRRLLGRRSREGRYARTQAMVRSQTPFRERLVMFWSNHFTISVAARRFLGSVGAQYENEAIRPHVFGQFYDMVLAVVPVLRFIPRTAWNSAHRHSGTFSRLASHRWRVPFSCSSP